MVKLLKKGFASGGSTQYSSRPSSWRSKQEGTYTGSSSTGKVSTKPITKDQAKDIERAIQQGKATPAMKKSLEDYEKSQKEASPISRVEYAKGAGNSRVQIIYYKDGRREVIKYVPSTTEELYKVKVPTKTGTSTIYMSKGAVDKYSQYVEEQRKLTATEQAKEAAKKIAPTATGFLGGLYQKYTETETKASEYIKNTPFPLENRFRAFFGIEPATKGMPEWEKSPMGLKEKFYTWENVKAGKLPLGSYIIGKATLAWYGSNYKDMREKPLTYGIEQIVTIGAGAIIGPVTSKGYSIVMKSAAKYGSKGVFAAKSLFAAGGIAATTAWVAPKGKEFIEAPTEQEKAQVLAGAVREFGLFTVGTELTKGISTRWLGKGLIYEQLGQIEHKPTRELYLSRFETTMSLKAQPSVSKFMFPETFPKQLKKPTINLFKEQDVLVYGTTAQKPQMPFFKHTRELGDIDIAVKDTTKFRSYLKNMAREYNLPFVEKKTVINIGKGNKIARYQLHTVKEAAKNPFWTGKIVKTREGIKMITLSEQAGRKFQGMLKGREKDIGDYYKVMKNLFKSKELRIIGDILPFKETRLKALAKTQKEFFAVSPSKTSSQLKFEPFKPDIKTPTELLGTKLKKSRPLNLKLREKIIEATYKLPFKETTNDLYIKGGGGEVAGYYDLRTGDIVIKQPKSQILQFITRRERGGVLLHEVMHKKYYQRNIDLKAPTKEQIQADYILAYGSKDFNIGGVGYAVGSIKGKQLFKFIDTAYEPKYRFSEYLSYYSQEHPEQVIAPTTETGKYLHDLYYGETKSPEYNYYAPKAAAYTPTYIPKKYTPTVYPKTSTYPKVKIPTYPKPTKYPQVKPPKYNPPTYPKPPKYPTVKYPKIKPPKYPPVKYPPLIPPTTPPPVRKLGITPPFKPADMKIKLFTKREYAYTPSLRFAFGIPAKYKVPRMKLLTGIEERPFRKRKRRKK